MKRFLLITTAAIITAASIIAACCNSQNLGSMEMIPFTFKCVDDIIYDTDDGTLFVEYWDDKYMDADSLSNIGYDIADKFDPYVHIYIDSADLQDLCNDEHYYWNTQDGSIKNVLDSCWVIAFDGHNYQLYKQ